MARSKAYLFGGVEIRWRCDPELLKRVDLNKVRMIAAALFLVIGLWVLAQTAGLFGAG